MFGRLAQSLAHSRKSIGIQLFLITFAGTLILVSTLGYASYAMSKSILKDKVSQASQETLAQATDKLDFLLNSYAGLTRQLLVDTALRDLLVTFSRPDLPITEKQPTQDRIVDRINSMQSSEPNILAIRFMPKNYEIAGAISSTGSSSVQMTDGIQGWLKRMIDANGEVVFVPTLNEGLFGYSREPSLTVGRLLRNLQNPEAEYIVLIELRGKIMTDIFERSRIGQSGELIVATDEGSIVYAASPERIGQAVPAWNEDDTLVLTQPSQATSWQMIGTVPVDELVHDSGRILSLTLWMAALAAAAAALMGYLMARAVGRPLSKMYALMERGENGDLTVRMDPRGPNEIARLAGHFNRMMEQIGMLVTRSNLSAQRLVSTAKELKGVSAATAVSAGEIAEVTGMISEGAASLAAEAEQGLAVTEAIGAKMVEVCETNERLAASAARVRAVSDQGSLYMLELVGKTEQTEQLSHSLAERVGGLKASAGSIRTIMDMMHEMSKRTNILSLNASIEAARAGAMGKSFSVVAGEIRKLAEQSKHSIGIVQQMTEDIQEGIDGTVAELGTISPLLLEQHAAVKEAASIFSEVRSQMGLFAEEIEQSTSSVVSLEQSQRTLSDAIENVSAVSQQSAASTEEVATLTSGQQEVSAQLVTLSEELESLSGQLHEVLVRFHTGDESLDK